MKLSEIRKIIGYNPHAKLAVKEATRSWLCGMYRDYPIGLTLTVKQTIVEETPRGTLRRAITQADCEQITQQFIKKLNRAVFGRRAAEKYGKSLRFMPIVEGERSGKALHLHFALGGFPSYRKLNEIDSLVRQAKKNTRHLDEQHKVDLVDSGWIEYITKETSSKHSDNVLWTQFT